MLMYTYMSIFTYDMYIYIYMHLTNGNKWLLGNGVMKEVPTKKGMNHDEAEKQVRGYLDDWDGLFGQTTSDFPMSFVDIFCPPVEVGSTGMTCACPCFLVC